MTSKTTFSCKQIPITLAICAFSSAAVANTIEITIIFGIIFYEHIVKQDIYYMIHLFFILRRFIVNKDLSMCPVEVTLQLISNKWKVLIIRDLLTGTKRFSELMHSVTGITQKVLTSNLRSMEEAGLIIRTVYPEVPPKVEYSLTQTGLSLKPVLDSMALWGHEYIKNNRSEL